MQIANRFTGRSRHGITLLIMLFLLALRARGAEVVITVTGTLNGGHDYLGIFGMGQTMPAGTPYTLVYAFDDAKGEPLRTGQCANSGSGIIGAGHASPATAVLTIAGKSYVFGRRPDARSSIWRSVVSGCSGSEIGINITEGPASLSSGVETRLAPRGQQSLTQDGDWRSALSLSSVYARNTFNSFSITQPGNYAHGTQSYLSVSTVTIGGPKQASASR